MDQLERKIGNYEVGQMLGKGGFGHVRVARKEGSKTYKYAIKYMKKNKKHTEEQLKYILKQESSLKGLDHEGILKIHEVNLNGHYTKRSNGKLTSVEVAYAVLQLAPNGDLFDFIAAADGLSEDAARWYFERILGAVHYLHSRGIAHRDIKLENVLLDENYNPLICDFGLSARLEKIQFMTNDPANRVGTENCMSPELFHNAEHSPIKDDIFALGYLLFMLVAKHQPFQRPTADNSYYYLIKNNMILQYWHFMEKFHSQKWCTKEFKHLVTSMFSAEMVVRPSLAEIKEHPWMKVERKYTSKELRAELEYRLKNVFEKQLARVNGEMYTEPERMESITSKAVEVKPLVPTFRDVVAFEFIDDLKRVKPLSKQVTPKELPSDEDDMEDMSEVSDESGESEESKEGVSAKERDGFLKMEKGIELEEFNTGNREDFLLKRGLADDNLNLELKDEPEKKAEDTTYDAKLMMPTKTSKDTKKYFRRAQEGIKKANISEQFRSTVMMQSIHRILTTKAKKAPKTTKVTIRPKLTMLLSKESIGRIVSVLSKFLSPEENHEILAIADIRLEESKEAAKPRVIVTDLIKDEKKNKVCFQHKCSSCLSMEEFLRIWRYK
eukprot:TRINITY_DN1356_c0_g2_i1.p1 TRINITY_DN1356_c0_g2~~TRINITY_DN1356_c0_g2_i1.p1  ORF type:complete len:610 (+),score=139.46 TRINITY_DN1356_c0_g2_i1:186-2015(+)